jgi:hypothetical protein
MPERAAAENAHTLDPRDLAETAAMYLRFADEEARGRSPLYEELTQGVAADQEIIEFLLTLPREKRQPNLLLAALRHVCGIPADWPDFRRKLAGNRDAIRSVMLTRSTQTNEPARCATLLPVLARLPQPLALIEVGASAGLCLLPDRYAYDFGGELVRPATADIEPPRFSCSTTGPAPLPAAPPRVVWRAGLDLNPLDISAPAQAAWLETLVWPEQTERLANLRAAIRVAETLKPRVHKGDLRTDLARLAGEAPKDATLVIFHTAVLSYVASRADRQGFAALAKSLCQYWLSNEAPRAVPELASAAQVNDSRGRFLLCVNGVPMAWTDPHGASLEWTATATQMASAGLDAGPAPASL